MKKLAAFVVAVVAAVTVIVLSIGTRTELTVSRTFHRPITFQITDRFGTCTLRTIIRSGAGGYDPGPIASDVVRELLPAEATAVRNSLKSVWASSPKPPNGMVLDGSHWSLRLRSFPFRKIEVRSPDLRSAERNTQPLYDLGLLLWRAAKINEPEKYLY